MARAACRETTSTRPTSRRLPTRGPSAYKRCCARACSGCWPTPRRISSVFSAWPRPPTHGSGGTQRSDARCRSSWARPSSSASAVRAAVPACPATALARLTHASIACAGIAVGGSSTRPALPVAHAPTPPTASIGSLGLDGGRGGGTRSTSRAGRSRQRSAPPSLFADPFSHLSNQVETGARVGWGCLVGGWRLAAGEGERVGRRGALMAAAALACGRRSSW